MSSRARRVLKDSRVHEPEVQPSPQAEHPADAATKRHSDTHNHPSTIAPVSTAPRRRPIQDIFSEHFTAFFSGKHPVLLFVFCLLYVAFMGVADLWAPPDMIFGVFYLIPVSLASWFLSRFAGISLSVLAAVVWYLVENQSSHRLPNEIFYWNFLSRLGIFLIIVVALSHIRTLHEGLQALVRKRTAQLEAEVAQRLAVEREVSAISNREQERIGHELHDGLGQHLAGISFRAKALEQSLAASDAPQAAEARELTGLLGDAIAQARRLARGLDPIELEDNDLAAALQNLAVETCNTYDLPCVFKTFGATPSAGVSKETALALYRICQEAIHNAVRHGQPSRISIDYTSQPDALQLRIQDDGIGFAPQSRGRSGMGLHIMRIRADSVGGAIDIDSRPKHGTVISCTVPVAKSPNATLAVRNSP